MQDEVCGPYYHRDTVRKAIKELEDEIKELEAMITKQKPRRAVGVVPRDW